jgi:hypothetical protein
MPSAAPISGIGVVRVETVSFGGTVKERVMAILRGVVCSGVQGVVEEEVDIFRECVLCETIADVHATLTIKGFLVAVMVPD